ncbi:aminoacyl-histidine dipeptidase [bacterium]|nr:aminoacyl-histidine dipeptidase [bacterium]
MSGGIRVPENTTVSDALAQNEPRAVWGHFSSILRIPRASRNEKQIIDWIRSIAAEREWPVRTDRAGNLCVDVPATSGLEKARKVVLQGHVDMVCEKNRDTIHDFDRDPIAARLDGEWVTASGTTLGADNGIGIAAALAVATDPQTVHGPLQLLFTVDEETGLTGAMHIDPSMIEGRILLNLDSEEDGVLCVGCAGGGDVTIDLPLVTMAPDAGSRAHRLEIRGLHGGHSGIDIDANRGNAIKLATRLLIGALNDEIAIELVAIHGGSKHNAIPREAEALIFVAEGDIDRLRTLVSKMTRDFRTELRGSDEGLEIHLEPAQHEGWALEHSSRNRLLHLLMALPHGVLAMSTTLDDLVETSSCVAVVESSQESARIIASARSTLDSTLGATLISLRSIAALAGAEAKTSDVYPGWQPNLESRLLATMQSVCADVWGEEPHIGAVHAGLECGLLGRKIPGLDMISFGPEIEGAHSPEERVHVPSVQRFWAALCRVLEVIAESDS